MSGQTVCVVSSHATIDIWLDERQIDIRNKGGGQEGQWGQWMGLREIAGALRTDEEGLELEAQLVAWFSNVLRSLDLQLVQPVAVHRRIVRLISCYEKGPGRGRAGLREAWVDAANYFHEEDHYDRPQTLTEWLDQRAVTIQADNKGKCGLHWLREGRPQPAKVIADRFRAKECAGWIGQENKPIWLTPYVGEVAELCEEARSSISTRRRAEIVFRVAAKLGLDVYADEGLLAFVTKETIGELLFDHPRTRTRSLPRGSTIVEARTHRRFRVWPTGTIPDPYGRTYDRDRQARLRASPHGHYGVAEAIRPRLPMNAFADCIYLGQFTNDAIYDDPDTDYLDAVGATGQSAADVLERLARMTGL